MLQSFTMQTIAQGRQRMAVFCVLVSANPFSSQGHSTAGNFCLAALAAGHEIPQIFFYHDAVMIANNAASPPTDEINPAQRWLQLDSTDKRELVVCVAAAQRRGITGDDEVVAANLIDGFSIGGLGLLAEAMDAADRFVHFG